MSRTRFVARSTTSPDPQPTRSGDPAIGWNRSSATCSTQAYLEAARTWPSPPPSQATASRSLSPRLPRRGALQKTLIAGPNGW